MNVIALALLSAVLMLSAMAPPTPAPAPPPPPVKAADAPLLVVQMEVASLDPHKTTVPAAHRVMRQLYETLVELDAEGNLQPGLATSWQRTDALTWEFRIRQGVKFHNGDPLTARDVKFSLERLLNPDTRSPGSFMLEAVASVTVRDAQTVVIRTREPFAPLPYHLAHTITAILSERAVREAGAGYEWAPVGTGPYQLTNLRRPMLIELTRFDGYWGAKAAIEQIQFLLALNTQMLNDFAADELVDLAFGYEPAGVPQTHLRTIRTPGMSLEYLGFNTAKPPFDKVEVRQAVRAALDLERLIEPYPAARVATGPLSPTAFGAHKALPSPTRDLAEARRLLKQAGLEQGFETTLLVGAGNARSVVAERVKAQLAEVGITVKVVETDFATMLVRSAAGEHDLFLLGWINMTADADYGLYRMFHSSAHGSLGNRAFYLNPKVDALLDLGRSTMDPATRLTAYHEVQALLYADVPVIFTGLQEEVSGVTPGLKGFVPHPTGRHLLSQVRR